MTVAQTKARMRPLLIRSILTHYKLGILGGLRYLDRLGNFKLNHLIEHFAGADVILYCPFSLAIANENGT